MRHLPRLGRRVLVAGLSTLTLLLAVLTAVSPVLATADCVPTVAAFSPGEWAAHDIRIYKVDTDDWSTAVVEGRGGFRLSIDGAGTASGSFSLVGSGYVQSWVDGDDGGLEAQYMVTAALTGNGAIVRVDGTRDLAISGVVDSNPSGDGDEWSGSGQDLWEFGNETTIEYHETFSPSAANCNTAFGSLGGPVAFGADASSSESFFVAVRIGGAPDDIDVESQLVDLLDRAEEVLGMDPLESEVLQRFVNDLLAFDALLTSLEYCEEVDINAGPIWQMLRSVLINAGTRFFQAALAGAYSTRDVIVTLTTVLQGGSLGWRGEECLEPIGSEDTEGILGLAEDVLLDRLTLAWGISDVGTRTAEIQQIAAAAYQFGLERVIAALEGRPE